MNGIVNRALAAVQTTSEHANIMAALPPEAAASPVQPGNSLKDDIDNARLAVQAAMDEVDGPALTALDYACADLEQAGQVWETNRPRCAELLRSARDHMTRGVRRI